ncbi:hypothetical protein [Methylobacterium sp. UNC300MFChir4.1]|uniref:hypothetical protein n=1 Tax=Methylobacterium sp. UNC300MFChir4.1 TaxID=1502747 RepID=UPI00111370BB|nr:hypothetical protein [Methylobacterium sp. UNC300MFChir4.1]
MRLAAECLSMSDHEDVKTGYVHLAREVHYRNHDGLFSVAANPNETAIDAVVRAEVARSKSIDRLTIKQSAGGFDGSSVWDVEGWKKYRSIYRASITILYVIAAE